MPAQNDNSASSNIIKSEKKSTTGRSNKCKTVELIKIFTVREGDTKVQIPLLSEDVKFLCSSEIVIEKSDPEKCYVCMDVSPLPIGESLSFKYWFINSCTKEKIIVTQIINKLDALPLIPALPSVSAAKLTNAVTDDYIPENQDYPIKFRNIEYNIGIQSLANPVTPPYTYLIAPIAGLYQIIGNARVQNIANSDGSIRLRIMVNNAETASQGALVPASNAHTELSVSVQKILQKGDKVSLALFTPYNSETIHIDTGVPTTLGISLVTDQTK